MRLFTRGDQRFDRVLALGDRGRALLVALFEQSRPPRRATGHGRRTGRQDRRSRPAPSTSSRRRCRGSGRAGPSCRWWRRRLPAACPIDGDEFGEAASTDSCSIELRLVWAPPSTSCTMPLASRSRSSSAVVSARSMPWVSSSSETVDAAACLDCSTAPLAVCCSSLRLCDTVTVACDTEALVESWRSLSVRLTMLVALVLASLMMRASSLLLSIMACANANALTSIALVALSAARSISIENWPPLVAMALISRCSCRRAGSSAPWIAGVPRW